MDFENEVRTLKFQIDLLRSISPLEKYPLTQLILESNISEEELRRLFQLLEELQEEYYLQQEDGFVHFSNLLISFVGQLPEKFDPEKTLIALKKENKYPEIVHVMWKSHFESKKND